MWNLVLWCTAFGLFVIGLMSLWVAVREPRAVQANQMHPVVLGFAGVLAALCGVLVPQCI